MHRLLAPIAVLGALLFAGAGAQAQNLDQVRRGFAQMVYADSSADINLGQPQSMLRAVVVLRIRLTDAGHWAAEVMRENDLEPELTHKAVASVEHLPTPPDLPPALVDQLHRDGFVEAWLFQNDSHFALKTLALPQRGL